MFRQAARRCGRQASTIAAPSVALRSRALLPSIRLAAASTARSGVPFRTFAFSARAYSSEATAAKDSVAPTEEEITRFRDLDRLGVHPNLIRAITDDMGYETMTPVQAKTIVPALKGSDIVAQAKTGTGKTLAFLLPLFQRMLDEDPSLVKRKASYSARADDIRGIVISPTRELAEQIAVEAENLAKHTGLVVQVAVGGTDKRSMLRKTQREGCHLLVATPGRLNDLLRDESSGVDAPKLAAMVLDEADRILDVGFEQQLYDIQQCLPNVREKVRQTMLVSATIPEDVIRLARKMVRPDDFEFVQTIGENESLTHDRVPQHVVSLSSWANMFPTLFELIDRESARVPNFKAIIYFNTTAMTELGTLLTMQRRRSRISPLFVWGINSRMTQMGRQRAADQFRTAQSGILVSSDVTARGMDFPNVTHVIQVDMPQERESYIHRVGRTARQGKDGQAWLLLPSLSAGPARRLLGGLPLQPNDTLSEVADVAVDGSAELPPIFDQVKELVPLVRSEAFQPAYTSLFGGAKADKNAVARDLNKMFTAGLGFEKPPAVSPLLARRLGISLDVLNTDQPAFDSRGSRGGDRPNRRSFNDDRGDRDAPSGDAFDRMRSNIRSDRPSNFGRQDARRERPGGHFRRHDRTDRNDRNDRYRSNRGRGDSRPSGQ